MEIVQQPSLDRLLEFEKVSWPADMQATRDQLDERITLFHSGIFMLKDEGKDVSQITVVPKDIPQVVTGFEQMRDKPVDRTSLDLWVLNIATHRDTRGKGYASYLMAEVIEWAIMTSAESIQTGITCPGYSYKKNEGEVDSVQEYMQRGLNPTMRVLEEAAEQNKRSVDIVKIIPNYWPIDADSAGYGVWVKIVL